MGTHNTTDIYKQIGEKIRELRTTLRGKGISQEDLAHAMRTTANTVSRWETAVYKPSILDLARLARFFGVPVTVFFPQIPPASRANALLSAAGDLDDEDLEEVLLYAQFRRARQKRKKPKLSS
jgi:transcriptional regulator with XRE-family HTH domain